MGTQLCSCSCTLLWFGFVEADIFVSVYYLFHVRNMLLNMSGFLKGHPCTMVLIKLTDDWRSALDKNKEMGVIAMDLSKAFDYICHNLLRARVKAYGVQEPALQLLRSYLQ